MSGIAIMCRMKLFDGLIKGLLIPDPDLSPSKGQILLALAIFVSIVVALAH